MLQNQIFLTRFRTDDRSDSFYLLDRCFVLHSSSFFAVVLLFSSPPAADWLLGLWQHRILHLLSRSLHLHPVYNYTVNKDKHFVPSIFGSHSQHYQNQDSEVELVFSNLLHVPEYLFSIMSSDLTRQQDVSWIIVSF